MLVRVQTFSLSSDFSYLPAAVVAYISSCFAGLPIIKLQVRNRSPALAELNKGPLTIIQHFSYVPLGSSYVSIIFPECSFVNRKIAILDLRLRITE